MEIKLRARLSAYSKIDSIETLTNRIPSSAIDTLFKDTLEPSLVTKGDINTMFQNEEPDRVVDRNEIDGLFQYDTDIDRKVTYAEIDSLFD